MYQNVNKEKHKETYEKFMLYEKESRNNQQKAK